jgi:hypothetical protein
MLHGGMGYSVAIWSAEAVVSGWILWAFCQRAMILLAIRFTIKVSPLCCMVLGISIYLFS